MDEAIHTTWQWVQLLSGIALVVFLLGAVIFWRTGKRTRISQPETDGVEK